MPPDPADAVAELPPLRALIAAHQLGADKRLGQHFLLDLNLTGRIARAAGDLSQGTTIEIGPGPGGLTRALLMAGAASVVAVERDRRCVAALAELVAASGGRLTVIEADALTVDLTALPAPRRIVANLPYNVGTKLTIAWLREIDAFESLTLMFQREVARRLAASPGREDYGRLSVLAQTQADVRLLFDIPARAFTPPPKVMSAVVRLTPRAIKPVIPSLNCLETVTEAAFGQRRKMLRSSLKTLGVPVEMLLDAAGITPTARAEEIDIEGFASLARAFQAIRQRPASNS